MPILGGLTFIMCSVVGYIGAKVYDKLSEMSNHLVSIKEELKCEINSLDRRITRLESFVKVKFQEREGDYATN